MSLYGRYGEFWRQFVWFSIIYAGIVDSEAPRRREPAIQERKRRQAGTDPPQTEAATLFCTMRQACGRERTKCTGTPDTSREE